ncbi:bifunctional 4-hydroxy-2-oxoglutarate aldolase/2-dehydro-3-deoxy-phosphogluconate aldolase [Sphingomonas sp. NSE70-1]|uniref:2-dehydro-3-deoxy-phosphogluconate aldolase n=1 Tax=Sphingomonas caseinilyticus TaxID=2908205 RepID=A0ABT0RU55_9SPHN|nr:bifunctional 4-hydroxy-2-oxoglutarate aldolase/2-dehydro-3-deoxy-phosphogluconate aldolase [Sphingomonas caseinilyticus]MCL6698363.1 bifunctional 4-hydroxy-2-oxoglutarate aldolase/2-dehydro-3-deoxy-phosphogluconate aldolase [Sphingomonas caseinilyticus]
MNVDVVMTSAPVIPVLVLDGLLDPVALAEALVEAGLPVIEVTLRTPSALDAIKAMSGVAGAIVGAGTVLNDRMLGEAIGAGSQFIISPGLTESLGKAAVASGVPFLPGVANAGDIMRGLDLGLSRFKFFPAEASGGIAALKAIAGPFGGVKFCPTGGIREETAPQWLALDNVSCVGGSWLLKSGDTNLAEIGERARRAARLKPA